MGFVMRDNREDWFAAVGCACLVGMAACVLLAWLFSR